MTRIITDLHGFDVYKSLPVRQAGVKISLVRVIRVPKKRENE